jgi:transcriptional regulator with XRE-family HTH domain
MQMTPTQAKQLGKLLAAARTVKGFTVRDVAERLDISRSWLSRAEQGKTLSVAPLRLARLTELLDIEPARVDQIRNQEMSHELPEVRTYFRAKYGLSSEDIAQIEEYARKYIDPPEQDAA